MNSENEAVGCLAALAQEFAIFAGFPAILGIVVDAILWGAGINNFFGIPLDHMANLEWLATILVAAVAVAWVASKGLKRFGDPFAN